MFGKTKIRERSSALGHLMVGAELDGALIPLGKVDSERLEKCLAAQEKGKMTDAMKRDLPDLLKKRDAPHKAKLSTGALTRVSDKWYGERFDYTKRVVTNATRKGNEREAAAIRQSMDYLGYRFAAKNEKHYEDEWTHGTPDVVTRFVFDIKCVWEPKGLEFFTDNLKGLYEWQVKDYCRHTGRDEGAIIRILMNPPEDMIIDLAKPLWEEAGYHRKKPITENFLADVKELYNFERKPIDERIRIVGVNFTEKEDKLIKQQIGLMREEWQRLDELFAGRNKNEIERFKSKTK